MTFRYDPTFTAFGPFVNSDTYLVPAVNRGDSITGGVVFGIVIAFAISTAYIGFRQTKRSRQPWKSAYIWMIWLEWTACVAIATVCLLFIYRIIRPSFYFFMGLLVCWTVQTQLLLQIIINRIRIIMPDRKRGKQLMIGTAIYMSLINISVFCVWIPARLQISAKWMHINEIWDRIEKVLYLAIDAYLNVYFIRTVKTNLIENGLQKYTKLVRFNQGMIVISLLMDIVVLAAMSMPNGFIYAIFHGLTWLVKLNIEMSMARLIKKIAMGSNNPHNSNNNAAGFPSYNSTTDANNTATRSGRFSTWVSVNVKSKFGSSHPNSSMPGGGIKKTEEFTVRSAPRGDVELQLQKPGAQVDIRSVEPQPTDFNRDIKDGKERRTKPFMSDEETLIDPRLARLPPRRSEDSSATHSMASDK
ncbi:hypothetical protein CC86DRAFT_299984 [Ophiobolus disseminans]|uniref:Integral membrane protein n=1 Tax=Ophiobolus disseminans TaxID=1469910 RepID=A0A6A6ZPG9_9PLEO|nr:hypothetical protein CC86DRAFT_299984 [Ophiobolus disseminans]